MKSLLVLGLCATITSAIAEPSRKQDMKRERDHLVVYAHSNGKKPYDTTGTAYSIFTFSQAVYGLPLKINSSYTLNPGYIKEWHWDFKRKTYVLKVDKSAKFHNGRNINSRDIEFMLLKSYFTPVDLLEKKWLHNIKGGDKIVRGSKYKSGLVEGVRIIDDETLEIDLERPTPTFLYNLTKSVPSLNPIEEMREDLINFKGLPIGAGNYKVIWDDPKTSLMRLERVGPNNGAPKIVDIVGDGDIKQIDPDIVLGGLAPLGNPELPGRQDVVGQVEMGISLLYFNFANPAGSNLNFRKLIYHSVNQESLVTGYESRNPIYELLPSGFWGRLNLGSPFNVKKAKDLLKQIPKELVNKEHVVKFHAGTDVPPYISVLEKNLKDIGLKVRFVRSNQHRLEKEDADVAMHIIGSPVEFQDPLNIFAAFLSDGPRPYQHPAQNHEYDELFYKALSAPDKERQAEEIKQISKYFIDNVYAVPLFQAKMTFTIGPRVRSLGDQIFGPTLDLEEVRLK